MIGNEVFIEEKIREFIGEDLGFGDITTRLAIGKKLKVHATIICNEEACIAGLEEAAKVFTILGCKVQFFKKDGDKVSSNTPLMSIKGYARAILKGERTALNLLARMAGIATITQNTVLTAKKVNPKIKVACTRKTAPGLRFFDKKAVELGGGDTHRLRLDDCILVKDNHLKLANSITEVVSRIKKRVSFTKKIEVEVETISQAIEAAQSKVDIIMLDNMKIKEIRDVLEKLEEEKLRKKVLIEASGGISELNISEYAKTGVDIISMGLLTHSIKAIDINLVINKT
jgi:nicotinate-nucleotide pyrophosphorylase (carboxylating)